MSQARHLGQPPRCSLLLPPTELIREVIFLLPVTMYELFLKTKAIRMKGGWTGSGAAMIKKYLTKNGLNCYDGLIHKERIEEEYFGVSLIIAKLIHVPHHTSILFFFCDKSRAHFFPH